MCEEAIKQLTIDQQSIEEYGRLRQLEVMIDELGLDICCQYSLCALAMRCLPAKSFPIPYDDKFPLDYKLPIVEKFDSSERKKNTNDSSGLLLILSSTIPFIDDDDDDNGDDDGVVMFDDAGDMVEQEEVVCLMIECVYLCL
jgi:hypothetical protein